MPTKTTLARVNGVELGYQIKGEGKPLVLLHGMLGSSRNWQTAGRDLAAKYHVFAPDLRNHGSSPHADSMGYAEMMADVLAWLEQDVPAISELELRSSTPISSSAWSSCRPRSSGRDGTPR